MERILHTNFIITNIDRRVFDVRFFYSWASWNCFGENIFKIHSVSFKEEDAQYSRAKLSVDFRYPNRQFYNTDRLYLRTVVMINGVPTDHAFASFKIASLVEKGKVLKPFKDYHGKKGLIYKYGKVLCLLKKSEQSAPMDFSEIQYMERKRFRVFLDTLVDKERLYFQRFRPLNDVIDKVIFDVYPKIGLDFPAQAFAPIKQIPIEARVLKKLIMKALEVYSMPEEQFIECCKSIGTVGRYTCEQILSLNALVLAHQFHGLGMNYQADVDIDPQTGRIFGIDRMGEGDDDFGFGDCENMNSTPREFFVAIEELPSDIPDALLAAVKDMLSYYFAMVISGSASQDSLSHVTAANKEKASINGHITALFLSKYECFKEVSDELPTFDDILERQEELAKKPARPHLLSVWVECTSPQCPVFNPKTEIMGEEAGQSCLSDMNELINLMVSNAIFSKLIAPVEQMQRGLTEASPNHFLNYIASGIISHFYDPFKTSLRQIALRPFLRQTNEENGNEQFVYGCDMNDIIANRVFWSALPPYDDEEMEALDHYIHHIPRIQRFHFTEDKRIGTLNFLHQRGKADCSTFYCMPLMMRLADVDNATLRAMDETLLKDSNVEYFKWTIVEMGNESLIFLNVRPVGLKRRMIALQSIMETSIYANQPNKSCRVLGMRTFRRSNVGDRTFLEFSVNKMTYALSFQFMDESEQERVERFLKTHLRNNGEKFVANVYFGTDGLHIEPMNSQAGELIITSINDLALEKYQRPTKKSVRFNANLQHYLLHVNVKDIDSNHVHSADNNYQFVANNHFVYHAQLEDVPSDASLSFKENVSNLKGLTYSKMVSMELHKEDDRTNYVSGIIEQEEVRMYYFNNFDHFAAFMPEALIVLIFKTVTSEKQFRFTIMINSKVVTLIITFAQVLSAEDQNILASATALSITENHLHFKGSFGEISIRDGMTFQVNENSTSLMDILNSTQQAMGKETEGIVVNWTLSPYRESPNKMSVIILASDVPLIVETYFARRNIHKWNFVGSNESNVFFVSHRLLDEEEEVIEYGYLSFKKSALTSIIKWQEKQQLSIAMHDNMIYMATEDESSQAVHFSIPTNVIFVQSTVELSANSLMDIMRTYLRPRESIGGSPDGSSLLLHCVPVHFQKISFNESYFIIYDPYAQLFVIIVHVKQSDEWNIHFVNLAYYEEFIISDSANELQLSAVIFKNILKDSATLISIMELLKVLRQRMGMNDIFFSKLLYYILYYISLKKDVAQNAGSGDSNLSIYFYCVSLLLTRSVFLNERDLKSWWEDESADLSLKLNYLLQLILSSSLKSFTIYPQEQSTYLSLEMRNVAF